MTEDKEIQEEEAKTSPSGKQSPQPEPNPQHLGDLKRKDPATSLNDIEFILDIPIEITIELGRTKMLINDLLKLGQGSVIELAKLAGEPLDILANHKLIARGEAVVLNEKFGIRLTDILSPMERIKQLK